MVGTATTKHPSHFGIANPVPWVKWKCSPFFFFFEPCGFPSQIRCRLRDRKTDTVVLWYCETPSASEDCSNFLSFLISVEFLRSLMHLTRGWQHWLCAIGVEMHPACYSSCLFSFLYWTCMSLCLLKTCTHVHKHDILIQANNTDNIMLGVILCI